MWKKIGRCYPSWFEIVPFALAIFSLGYLTVHYNELPGIIPSHFGADGGADAWTGKTFFTVYAGPLIGLIVYLSTALLNIYLLIAPEDPGRYMNFSVREKEKLGTERLEVIRTFTARSL